MYIMNLLLVAKCDTWKNVPYMDKLWKTSTKCLSTYWGAAALARWCGCGSVVVHHNTGCGSVAAHHNIGCGSVAEHHNTGQGGVVVAVWWSVNTQPYSQWGQTHHIMYPPVSASPHLGPSHPYVLHSQQADQKEVPMELLTLFSYVNTLAVGLQN